MDFKASEEFIKLVKDSAVAITTAKADGTVNWLDLLRPESRALIPDLMKAVQDGKLLPEELSSATPDQLTGLVVQLGEAVGALVLAVIA